MGKGSAGARRLPAVAAARGPVRYPVLLSPPPPRCTEREAGPEWAVLLLRYVLERTSVPDHRLVHFIVFCAQVRGLGTAWRDVSHADGTFMASLELDLNIVTRGGPTGSLLSLQAPLTLADLRTDLDHAPPLDADERAVLDEVIFQLSGRQMDEARLRTFLLAYWEGHCRDGADAADEVRGPYCIFRRPDTWPLYSLRGSGYSDDEVRDELAHLMSIGWLRVPPQRA